MSTSADECCICFGELVRGETAIICPPRVANGRTVGLHTVCHDCVGNLYAAQHNWQGGGLCPSCREPLIPLDERHEYADSLPEDMRRTVEAAKARADARFVARIVREEEQQRAREARAPPQPYQRVQRARPRRKRTMREYANDIANIQDPNERAFKNAFRIYAQNRSRLTTRAWRRKQNCLRAGISWHDDPQFIELTRIAEDWQRDNPRPVREDFVSA